MGQEDRDWYREKWKQRAEAKAKENAGQQRGWPSTPQHGNGTEPRLTALHLVTFMLVTTLLLVYLLTAG